MDGPYWGTPRILWISPRLGKFAIRLRLGHTTHAGDGGRREAQPRFAANTAPTKKHGDHTQKTSETRTETLRWERKRETLSGATSMT